MMVSTADFYRKHFIHSFLFLFLSLYYYFLGFFFHLVKTSIDIVISIILLVHLNSVETHNQSNLLFIFMTILDVFF